MICKYFLLMNHKLIFFQYKITYQYQYLGNKQQSDVVEHCTENGFVGHNVLLF